MGEVRTSQEKANKVNPWSCQVTFDFSVLSKVRGGECILGRNCPLLSLGTHWIAVRVAPSIGGLRCSLGVRMEVGALGTVCIQDLDAYGEV